MLTNLLLDNLSVGIIVLNERLKIEYLNKAIKKILVNHSETELEEIIKNIVHHIKDFALNEMNFYEEINVKIKRINNNKQLFYILEFYDLEKIKNIENNENFKVMNEINYLKKRNLSLKEKAYKDILTGLYNRNFYEDKMRAIFEAKKDKIYSIMVIDLDKFKDINDIFGHDKGDLVLKRLASVLKDSVRKDEDYIVRMGGDELCIIIPSTLVELQKIKKRIEYKLSLDNEKSEISCEFSVGMAERKLNENLDLLYKRADIEL